MRKGEEGCRIETAMYSVYILNQERNHVTKSHVKIQFTVYRVNFRCQADITCSNKLHLFKSLQYIAFEAPRALP
jgi:hypothetical protein